MGVNQSFFAAADEAVSAAMPVLKTSGQSAKQKNIRIQTPDGRMASRLVGSVQLSRKTVPHAVPLFFLFPFPIAISIIDSSRSFVAGFGGVGRRLSANAALRR